MKDHCVMGMIFKVLGVLLLVIQEVACIMAVFESMLSPLGGVVQMLAALLWPAILWSFGELLDRQRGQERKLDRILELLGDVEEPEEDLTQLETQLEEVLESGEEPEGTQEEE